MFKVSSCEAWATFFPCTAVWRYWHDRRWEPFYENCYKPDLVWRIPGVARPELVMQEKFVCRERFCPYTDWAPTCAACWDQLMSRVLADSQPVRELTPNTRLSTRIETRTRKRWYWKAHWFCGRNYYCIPGRAGGSTSEMAFGHCMLWPGDNCSRGAWLRQNWKQA